MDLEFSHIYKNLPVHHLERSEIEHELTVRAVQFLETENRSALSRKLRDRLKEERDKNEIDIEFIRCYKSVDLEIKEIDGNLVKIRSFLEKETRFEGLRESLKTRLVHYFHRARRVQEEAEKDEDLNDLDKIMSGIRQMMNTHFPAIGPSEMIRDQVINQIAQTLSQLNLQALTPKPKAGAGSKSQKDQDKTDQDNLLSEAGGGSPEVDPVTPSNRRTLKSVQKLGKERSKNQGSANKTIPERLIRKFSLNPNSNRNPVPSELSDTVSSAESESSIHTSEDSVLDSVPRPRSRVHRQYRHKRRPVSEWNLKYDGKDNGQNLMRFIKEVQFYAKSEEVSERELFRSAIYLFKDQAKVWFMAGIENEDFSTWKELVSELKREFLSPDHDHVNETRAISRKQSSKERFSDFLAEMQKIFNSLTRPMTEKKKFEIVFRNLRADYKAHVIAANIDNLADLKKFGRQLDATYWFKYNSNPQETVPSRNRAQVNEVSFGQKPRQNPPADDPNKKFKSREFYRSTSARSEEEPAKSKTQEPAKPTPSKPKSDDNAKGLQVLLEKYQIPKPGICFNCRLPGHHSKECEGPKHKFCRKCGFLNYDTDKCPFCAKNAQ